MPARRTFPWGVVGGGLLAVGLAAIALRSIPPLQLANRWTVLATALSPLGVVAFAAAALCLAASRHWPVRSIAVVAVAGLALQGWWLRPYWPAAWSAPVIPAALATPTDATTLLTVNLRCNPPGVRNLAALVQSVQPDVVVVEGLADSPKQVLDAAWGTLLPYRTAHPQAATAKCQTAVYSRTPVRRLSPAGDQQSAVEVTRGKGNFVLLPVDLATPSNGVTPWLDAFANLTHTANAYPGVPLVLAGDFNAVLEHEPLRRLIASGLKDSAVDAGASWTPTFSPFDGLPPLLALDHVLVSSGLNALEVRTEPVAGQQHRALIARIAF